MANHNGIDALILDRLFKVIESRRDASTELSYTAKLFAKGPRKIARKVGEEAVEVVVAALSENRERVAEESADLLYHLLVLWADQGLKARDVWLALAEREGVSGVVEKRSRAGAD